VKTTAFKMKKNTITIKKYIPGKTPLWDAIKLTLPKITETQQPEMMWCGYAGKLCGGKCSIENCPLNMPEPFTFPNRR